MTAGIILVLVMLLLGGVIATVSDRLGTKVGKARLSLFKMRPRDTAVWVTVVTGTVLSALTLGVLFAASKPLRTGVFQIDEIEKRLRGMRRELNDVNVKKQEAERELVRAKKQELLAQLNLDKINQSLKVAIARQQAKELKLKSLQEQLQRVEMAKSETQSQLKEVESAKVKTETQLRRVEGEKNQAEIQLNQAKMAKSRAENQLAFTETQLRTISTQKSVLDREIKQLQREREELIQQRDREIALRDQEILKRDQSIRERDVIIITRDEGIAERDRMIRARDDVIAFRENHIKSLEIKQAELEKKQANLQEQLKGLERDFWAIRGGNVLISRGQVLASGVVRVVDPNAARLAVDQLLQEANLTTLRILKMDNQPQERVILITNEAVDKLIKTIENGQDYLIKIVAAANYLQGEKMIQVFPEAKLNRLVFVEGDLISSMTFDPKILTDVQIRNRLQRLIDAAQFRASLVEIVGSRVELANSQVDTLLKFFQKVKQYQKTLEIQAIATGKTYLSGPLMIELVAVDNGKIVFRTGKD